jgi:hypothetical protein
MPRLTITLSKERHRALKEAAFRRGKTIGEIIDDSLDLCGIKTIEEASQLVARARSRAGLSESEALKVATEETRVVRRDATPPSHS